MRKGPTYDRLCTNKSKWENKKDRATESQPKAKTKPYPVGFSQISPSKGKSKRNKKLKGTPTWYSAQNEVKEKKNQKKKKEKKRNKKRKGKPNF